MSLFKHRPLGVSWEKVFAGLVAAVLNQVGTLNTAKNKLRCKLLAKTKLKIVQRTETSFFKHLELCFYI